MLVAADTLCEHFPEEFMAIQQFAQECTDGKWDPLIDEDVFDRKVIATGNLCAQCRIGIERPQMTDNEVRAYCTSGLCHTCQRRMDQ